MSYWRAFALPGQGSGFYSQNWGCGDLGVEHEEEKHPLSPG